MIMLNSEKKALNNSGPEPEGRKNWSAPNLTTAYFFVKEKYYLFPAIWKNNKHQPLIKWKTKSSNDPEQIKKWAKQWSDVYFCIHLEKSRLCVIDVDRKKGKNGFRSLEQWGELPKTFTVKTPNNGRHYYFKSDNKPVRSQFGPDTDKLGIDIPTMVPLPGRTGKGEYIAKIKTKIADLPTTVETKPWATGTQPLTAEQLAQIEQTEMPDINALGLPDKVQNYIKGKITEDRSTALYAVEKTLIEHDLADEQVFKIIWDNPIGEKAREQGELWLWEDIQRARNKHNGKNTAAADDFKNYIKSALWLTYQEFTADNLKYRDHDNLHPPCLIQDYLYADVGILAGPGGVGKTTVVLYESILAALGRPVYDLEVYKPIRTIFVTAEDSKQMLRARTRKLCEAMELTQKEYDIVSSSVFYVDVSGLNQKLICLNDGNIELTSMAGDIIKAYQQDPPGIMIFDPVVSFGANESYVNDNAQGIITACRKIRNGLNWKCAIRLLSHTGQEVARNSIHDQYTARGGTALPDGARMVAVLQPYTDQKNKPENCAGTGLTILYRPKLSYTKPNLPNIWIRRIDGWDFEFFIETKPTLNEKDSKIRDWILTYVKENETNGKLNRITANHIEINRPKEITRNQIRVALNSLEDDKILVKKIMPGKNYDYFSVGEVTAK